MLFHLFHALRDTVPGANVFRYVSTRIGLATLTSLLITFIVALVAATPEGQIPEIPVEKSTLALLLEELPKVVAKFSALEDRAGKVVSDIGSTTTKIAVTDSASNTGTASLSFTIKPAVSVTTATTLPIGYVGSAYSQTLAATGGSAWRSCTAGARCRRGSDECSSRQS